MTTVVNKMTSFIHRLYIFVLKFKFCEMNGIGMHTLFPPADGNLMNSEKRTFIFSAGKTVVTFTVYDVIG